MQHDRERITVTVPYPFSNLKKLSGFSIQYLNEEGPLGTWIIVLLCVNYNKGLRSDYRFDFGVEVQGQIY